MGIRASNFQLYNKYVMDVKYSTGSVVNNIVITSFSVRWLLDLS